jgi:hypothetical protein
VRDGSNHSPGAPERANGQLLGELHSADEHQRVELWLRPGPGGGAELELRQFLWGSGVGWYAQKSLTLDPAQAAALPDLLPPAAATASPLPSPPPATPAVACQVVAGGAVAAPAAPRQRPRVERDGNAIRLRFE